MVEVDAELNNHIISLQRELKQMQRTLKLRKIIIPVSFILIFIYFCSFAKVFPNAFLVTILFWITFYFIFMYYVALEKELDELQDNIINNESEIKETENFIAYVSSCRQIEAKEHGKNIYPEMRYNDSLYIKEEFKEKFEKKRIEYEQHHLARLKLNPYYLDEKLAKAPIDTYPIHEQELLYEYKKNKTAFLEERKLTLYGKD